MDKAWPDDLNGVGGPQQVAERAAQAKQRRQRFKDYHLRRLRPRFCQRKAQEYLMERPNDTWNNFRTQINQKEFLVEVSSTFLSCEGETQAELATLGQELKTWTELRKYHVNARAIFCRTFYHGQQGRQETTRFCDYCRRNGHTK